MKLLFLIALLIIPEYRLRAQEISPSLVLDLDQCYQSALSQNESLAKIREQIFQFEQRSRQARAAILPNVNFIYAHSFQDPTGVDAGSGGIGGTLTRSERPEVKLSASQPIFNGFREFHAWRTLTSLKRKEELELVRAKKDLYWEVARAFYSVIQLETDRANNQAVLDLTTERVRELESRSRLGKSRQSEVLTVQSQVAALMAQDEKIRGDVWTARELLSFLAGRNIQGLLLQDGLIVADIPPDAESVLVRSSSVTELAIVGEDIHSRKHQVNLARGAFYPKIDLSGNYYLKRVGFQENIDWDALLSVNLPIFQGGENFAKLREAESNLRWSEWTYRRLKRQIESDIREDFYQLRSSNAQVKALEMAHAKAKESYEQQVKEYRYGLVNNLEVIQAMNTMQENKRNLDRTIILNKLNFIQLKVSTEDLSLPR